MQQYIALTLFDLESLDKVESSKPKLDKKEAIVAKSEVLLADQNETTARTKPKHNSTVKKTKKANEQEEKDKVYWSISDTAKKFGVRISHIRFWTTQFALKVRTNRKGDRLFSQENIEQLEHIYTLVKGQGYTIAGAKQKLREMKIKKEVQNPKDSLLNSVQKLQQLLLTLKEELQ